MCVYFVKWWCQLFVGGSREKLYSLFRSARSIKMASVVKQT